MKWELKPLGELCEVVTKGTTPTTAGHKFQESGINFIKVESIGLDGELLPDMFSYVTEECHREQARSQLKKNDILFSIAGALGRAALVGSDNLPANTNQALAIVRLRKDAPLDHRFLLKLLSSSIVTEQTARMSGGAAQQNLSLAQVKEIKVPIPPLPEQQRIVTKLDAAFAALREAEGHLERNRANARELFESYLNGVFEGKEDELVRLDEVCEITSMLVDPQLPEHIDLVHVGGGNIESKTGRLLDLKTARQEELRSGKFLFDESMVLYNKIRPYLVKVARPSFSGLCSADMYPLSPKAGRLDRDYLYYALLSNHFTEYAISGSDRAGMPKVNREHLFAYEFRLPSLKEQLRIAKALDALLSETQAFEATYQQKLSELEGLKKGLLGAAFRGEL